MLCADLFQAHDDGPLYATGALLQTENKFGHEMIAGPLIGGRQIVGHKEPGVGAHIEWLSAVRERYPITVTLPPVNEFHGIASWFRMAEQVGQPWGLLDNCQHGARRAYFGKAESPTLFGWGAAVGVALLLYFGRD